MTLEERDRRLRQRFGPPPASPNGGRPRRRWPPPRPRIPGRLLAAAAAVLVVVAGLGVFWSVTPHDHSAPGCFWWTASRVGDVTPGSRGCVRGYVEPGGALAESPDVGAYRLSYALNPPDTTSRRGPCPFRDGDAVVIRYHGISDDGRKLIIVDECR
ncbi:MAG: hypothetical protein J2P45_01680 [Candidatus Dormibacteraeota bacterium]|nr:hypothetical protein [Candidatus Dormibacteraeota bacterium]